MKIKFVHVCNFHCYRLVTRDFTHHVIKWKTQTMLASCLFCLVFFLFGDTQED